MSAKLVGRLPAWGRLSEENIFLSEKLQGGVLREAVDDGLPCIVKSRTRVFSGAKPLIGRAPNLPQILPLLALSHLSKIDEFKDESGHHVIQAD